MMDMNILVDMINIMANSALVQMILVYILFLLLFLLLPQILLLVLALAPHFLIHNNILLDTNLYLLNYLLARYNMSLPNIAVVP
jgi:hypothetical protein